MILFTNVNLAKMTYLLILCRLLFQIKNGYNSIKNIFKFKEKNILHW